MVVASGGNTDVAKFATALGCPAFTQRAGASKSGAVKALTPPPPAAFDWTGFEICETRGLKRPLLAIRCTSGGFLGCAYFDAATATKLDEVRRCG